MLDYHPPAKYLQILQWDSSAPEQDQDQCNKTVGGRGRSGRCRCGNTNKQKPALFG